MPDVNALIGLIGSEYKNVRVPSDYDLFETDFKNELYPENMVSGEADPEYFIFYFDEEEAMSSGDKIVELITVYWEDGFNPEKIVSDDFVNVDMEVDDFYFYQGSSSNESDFEIGILGKNENGSNVFVEINNLGGKVSGDDPDAFSFGMVADQFKESKSDAAERFGV